MNDGVALRLRVVWDGAFIVGAAVASARPAAARLLVGRSVDEAVSLAPRLFSLCGKAQGAAAQLAAATARGDAVPPGTLVELGREVALEAVVEHLWRLLLDWPALLGQPLRRDEFIDWRKRLLAVRDAPAAETLGAALQAWLASGALAAAAALGGARAIEAPVALLPWRGASAWAQHVWGPSFSAQPTDLGQPAETGALARQAGVPEVATLLAAGRRVQARLAARLADLRMLAAALRRAEAPGGWLEVASPAPGIGVARVETARGLLLHMTQVKDGRVGSYVIVAPTEWNFHPQGAFVREIVGAIATTRAAAESQARRLALALDPCVSYEVVVENA